LAQALARRLSHHQPGDREGKRGLSVGYAECVPGLGWLKRALRLPQTDRPCGAMISRALPANEEFAPSAAGRWRSRRQTEGVDGDDQLGRQLDRLAEYH
jgi:hypothetical protein